MNDEIIVNDIDRYASTRVKVRCPQSCFNVRVHRHYTPTNTPLCDDMDPIAHLQMRMEQDGTVNCFWQSGDRTDLHSVRMKYEDFFDIVTAALAKTPKKMRLP
jgi:hypothetical protein